MLAKEHSLEVTTTGAIARSEVIDIYTRRSRTARALGVVKGNLEDALADLRSSGAPLVTIYSFDAHSCSVVVFADKDAAHVIAILQLDRTGDRKGG